MTTTHKTAKLILWIEPDLKRWTDDEAERNGMSTAEFVRLGLKQRRDSQ